MFATEYGYPGTLGRATDPMPEETAEADATWSFGGHQDG
jgi:hypothetical protein